MFGNHGLCGLLEEGAHEKSPKCLGWEFRGFGGDFAKVSVYLSIAISHQKPNSSHNRSVQSYENDGL